MQIYGIDSQDGPGSNFTDIERFQLTFGICSTGGSEVTTASAGAMGHFWAGQRISFGMGKVWGELL